MEGGLGVGTWHGARPITGELEEGGEEGYDRRRATTPPGLVVNPSLETGAEKQYTSHLGGAGWAPQGWY